jgi:hypothetical protein
MALLYVEEHEKSLDSELANGTIYEGDLVVREEGGGVHTVDPTSDTDVDGIVVHLRHGDNIADHEEDFRTGVDAFPYEGDGTVGSDRVPIAIDETDAIFRPHTIADDSEPAPSIQRNTRVGIPAISGVSGIVEEGYEDSGATVYDESSGNFIPLGEAELDHGEVESGFEERVRVRLE